ncbi:hypothetical protein C2E20_5435 [Micractinium conductrix]|uniref:Peptidase M11 gametolysin domain-containing protein n=1 Tax=Micractinium conductrix TaxID=554055 RepID=A0A2P6VAJ0_9CHLO|nr:hypothetical protein C2E20_5435 [Micractinium conductrix]|eukprot:PSC71116.1 hypothetical protein C2E20_5435 [Micractinium conductrix]
MAGTKALAVLTLLAVATQVAGTRSLLADTLSGKAVVFAGDRNGKAPQRLLGVRTAEGKLVHVQASQAQLAAIHSGMQLPAAGGGAAAATAATRAAGMLSSNTLVAADISTIVVPISGVSKPGTACPGTQLPLVSVTAVRKAVLPELNPAGITVGSTFNKCSYGKSTFNAANSQVADLVQLPCNGVTNGVAWTFSKCDFDDFNGYADAADAALAARGIDLSRYKHRVYLIPPGQCGFVGLGYIGCDGSYACRSWIGADFWATPQAIVHEMGHNLYMAHAGGTNSEGVFDDYFDDSGTMGYCCQDRCPNTPHAWQLGWISVRQLDGTSLKPGVPVTLAVASQALSSQSGLRIVPSWAAGVDPIFVGYRTKANGDAALEPQLAGKLHLYTTGITNTYDPKVTSWKGSLSAAGSAWTHPTAGLVVRLKAAGRTAARVTLCRKAGKETLASCQAGMDNDCNGLVGVKDPRLLGVRTAEGKLVHVQASQAQLAAIHSGMQLPAAGGGAAAATAATRAAGMLSSNTLVAADISTIVVPISGVSKPGTACPGTQLPLVSVTAVRKAVLPELNPAGITVGSTFNKCSYGKSTFNAANSQVADLVQLPCNGVTNGVAWTFSKCDFDDFNGYADAADAALAARGIDLSRYKHRVYLIPPGQCGFVGLGYIGCDGSYACRSWIGADFWATPQAIVHEMGHNLYMAHAGGTNSEGVFDDYFDDSGTMGYCCQHRCPNTPHAWQLGWISVRQLDGTSLKPGVPVTLAVASQALSSQSGLRIVPSWAAGVDPIFVGYRTKANGDAALEPQLAGKLHLYTTGITNTYDPKVTSWKGSLSAAGSAWTHPTAGLVVRLKAAGRTAARVTLCRKAGKETLASCQAGMDNDCNGLVGVKDPRCSVLLRRRKRATAALPAAGGGAAAATAATPAAGMLSSNTLVAADISTIVIPISGVSKPGTACPGTQLPLVSVTAVRKAVLPELNPAGITVGSTFNKCSYGKSTFNAANSQVADLVQLPCNGVTNGVAWTFSKCDFDDFNGYADAADAALAARGIDLSRYKHRVYLIPPGQCGFVGLGFVGCQDSCRAWIGADFWATPQAIVHEMGHNLYMAHAGGTNSEGVFDDYFDDSGTMGYCCQDRCPNTPHAWQLGWISVRQLDGTSLKPGVPVTLAVASQALSSQSGLRIVPSWAAGVDPIFVGYRTKANGDAALEPQLAGKLHLYTTGITNTYDPKVTSWKGSLSAAGSAWTHPTAGLVVRLKSAGRTAARVTLCRKAGKETLASCQAGMDNDCNGLVGVKDPRCSVLLRRRKRATAAVSPAAV